MSADDNSSDYGSDFTPDEEALVDELLASVASVATEDAVPDTDRTAPAAVNSASGLGHAHVRDVEDYYASVPWVLGRKRLDAMVSGVVGLSGQEEGVAGTTLG